ncbi:MAG: hypothetical protein ACO32J_00625 [Phycisphaerales bacterium]|jgi:hypothetical protein
MQDPSPSSSNSRTHAGHVLVVGQASRWPEWMEVLVRTGHNVEVVPDSERALLCAAERWVEVLLVAGETAVDDAQTLERLHRVSPCTQLLLIGPGTFEPTATIRSLSDALPKGEFLREIQSALRASRQARERQERLEQLRGLAQRIRRDATPWHGGAESMIDAASGPASEMEALQSSVGEELDPLHAARETADFIVRHLPGAVVAVWLSGPAGRFGLTACSGTGDDRTDAIARLMACVERRLLARPASAGEMTVVASAAEWAMAEDAEALRARWGILAPCRADGVCHGFVMVIGPDGLPLGSAESAMDSIRTILGAHLARIERVHLRAQPDWPDLSSDPDEPGPSGDAFE